MSENNHQEHDSIFKKCLSNLEVAKDYLKQYLPKPLLDKVNLDSIEQCKNTFILGNLAARHTDVLFRMKLRGEDNNLYMAFSHSEHQSTPEKIMSLRCLLYELLIMLEHYKNHKKIPLVHTIVFYNGTVPWNYSRDIKDIIDAPRFLIDLLAMQPFTLIQLRDLPDEELSQHKWSGAMSILMKHIYDSDILPALNTVMDLLQPIQDRNDQVDGLEYIKALLFYAYQKGEIPDENAFHDLINTHLSEETGDILMTLAQQHIQQGFKLGREDGFQEGIQQGIQKGIQKGVQKGSRETEIRIVKKLLESGFSLDEIEKTLGINLEPLKNELQV